MGFFSHSYLKNVTIPASVRWKDNSMDRAFASCTNFNAPVVIPNGVTNLVYTFQSCSNFNQPITIPDSVTTARGAFYSCYNFNSPVKMGNGLTNLYGTFQGCSNFNQPVTIPNSVTSCVEMLWGARNFNQPLNIPDSVKNISSICATAYNFNSPVVIGNGVTDVYQAFSLCNMMNKNITIYAKNITNAYFFLRSKNNSKRINIFVPNGSTTNITISNTYANGSIVGNNITWYYTTNYRYNAKYNIYIYWNKF